jgi:hypothetical protein
MLAATVSGDGEFWRLWQRLDAGLRRPACVRSFWLAWREPRERQNSCFRGAERWRWRANASRRASWFGFVLCSSRALLADELLTSFVLSWAAEG